MAFHKAEQANERSGADAHTTIIRSEASSDDLKVSVPARPHGVTLLALRGGVGYDTGQLR